MSAEAQAGICGSYVVDPATEGIVRVRFMGRMDIAFAQTAWNSVIERIGSESASQIILDVNHVEYCDGAGMALLHLLQELKPGARVTIEGLKPEFQRVFDSYKNQEPLLPENGKKTRVADEMGLAASAVWRDIKEQVSFLGHLAACLPGTAFQARRMRWPEVLRVIEQAGVNALPIVSLISFLVGLIIAFEAAQPLAQFGAQIFIANMMGLLMMRELGPLMTAIMLAGRSGSAFAAELGTMKVNEELNALETMGLDPVGFLVVQRITAAFVLSPLLTVFAMAMGIGGGIIVMLTLGFPISAITSQLADTLTMKDLVVGVLKGTVFGGLVAAVGCLRGLQTKKGPAAVGDSTTRAVVASILLIILADAMFSVFIFVLER